MGRPGLRHLPDRDRGELATGNRTHRALRAAAGVRERTHATQPPEQASEPKQARKASRGRRISVRIILVIAAVLTFAAAGFTQDVAHDTDKAAKDAALRAARL